MTMYLSNRDQSSHSVLVKHTTEMTHNNYISSLLYNLYGSIMFIHPSIRLVHLSIYPSMFLPLPQLTLLHLNPNFHLETKTVHPSIHPSNVPIYSSMNSTFTCYPPTPALHQSPVCPLFSFEEPKSPSIHHPSTYPLTVNPSILI